MYSHLSPKEYILNIQINGNATSLGLQGFMNEGGILNSNNEEIWMQEVLKMGVLLSRVSCLPTFRKFMVSFVPFPPYSPMIQVQIPASGCCARSHYDTFSLFPHNN